jgi:hypothetical protein
MPHVWSKFTYTAKEHNVSIFRAEEFLVGGRREEVKHGGNTFFKMSVSFYQTTWQHTPDDNALVISP